MNFDDVDTPCQSRDVNLNQLIQKVNKDLDSQDASDTVA